MSNTKSEKERATQDGVKDDPLYGRVERLMRVLETVCESLERELEKERLYL